MSVPACLTIAPCSRPSTPLRAADRGGLRPVLTATARVTPRGSTGMKKRRSAEHMWTAPWQALFRFERFGRLQSYVRPLTRRFSSLALMKSEDLGSYQRSELYAHVRRRDVPGSVTTVSFITSMRLPNPAYAVETPFRRLFTRSGFMLSQISRRGSTPPFSSRPR